MPGAAQFSENSRINLVIENILGELCPFLEDQAREISEMTAIGKALGTGKDIQALLEMILSIARRLTRADGGTLYLVDHETGTLKFHVIQNESLDLKQTGDAIALPGVALYDNTGAPNLANVSSYVFHTGTIVNIADVYTTTQKFHFEGTKEFDQTLNYKSTSMVVIPMRNHEDVVIGILQLINAKDPFSGATVSFCREDEDKAAALASQASVILTQQFLIMEMRELFEAFIKAIAVSIDEKSKHTGGHIQRVTELSIMIAEAVNEDDVILKDVSLSEDQMDELRIAALMHDTGKITTPDHIIDKSSRLETIFDRITLIKTRWELIKTRIELEAARKKLALLDSGDFEKEFKQIDTLCQRKTKQLDEEFKAVSAINAYPDRLDQSHMDLLESIRQKKCNLFKDPIEYLTPDEYKNLTIPAGTLTQEERQVINSHAHLTEKILSKLPWPKKLAKIPAIASAHHEKLDGSGYPLFLKAGDLNLQARILSIADIFEALSAQDRPYKKPMTLSRTVEILRTMADTHKIDRDIVEVLISHGIHIKYAKNHLAPAQIDI